MMFPRFVQAKRISYVLKEKNNTYINTDFSLYRFGEGVSLASRSKLPLCWILNTVQLKDEYAF